MGIPAVLFVIAGAWLSRFFDARVLEIILAIFLLITSITLLVFRNIIVPPTQSNSIIGGALSGLVAGLVGTGGAIRGITLMSFKMKTEVFIATSAIIDLGIDSSRAVVYSLNGYVHKHDLYLIPILLVVSIVGTFIGKQILRLVSEIQFKRIVLILILLIGVTTLVQILMGGKVQ